MKVKDRLRRASLLAVAWGLVLLPIGQARAQTPITSLTLGAEISRTLTNSGDAQDFQVNVPANQRLVLQFKGDGTNDWDELYIRYGAMPTLTQYDAVLSNPNQPRLWGDWAATNGTYYLMAYAQSSADGAANTFRLRADTLATISPLAFGGMVSNSWAGSGDFGVYRLGVGLSSLPVIVQLKADGLSNASLLLARFPTTTTAPALPTLQAYDFGAVAAGQPRQSLVLTNPSIGTYYLLAYAQTNAGSLAGRYRIRADTQQTLASLSLNQPLAGSLVGSGDFDLFQLSVAANERIALQLVGDNAANLNGIYVSFGQLPSLAQSDFSAAAPGQAAQQVVIPATLQGTYYVMVYALNHAAGPADNYSLVAGAALGNHPPRLAPISTQTVNEGSLLSFPVSATDTDLPPQTLIFRLGPNPPLGASINPTSGLFTWTPIEGQGPSTNLLSVIVTDSGSPPLSATNKFTIIVNEVNLPPVVKVVPDQTVNASSLLKFQVTATDPELARETLTFTLGPNAPSGATLNPTNGWFSWTPSRAQAPSTNLVTVVVTDNGVPPLSATNLFTIFVNQTNLPPVLVPISNQSVMAGTPLTFPVVATDPDSPPETLTYSLAPNAPAGATIDSSSGVFSWIPTQAQGPSTNSMSVIVQDNGTPSLSATGTFQVIVSISNQPPVLASISDQAVYTGRSLLFNITASDADLPRQTLTFSLGANAPAGATLTPVNATNAQFSWTPTDAQGPSTNAVTVVVTDDGSPPLSDSATFNIVVLKLNHPPSLNFITNQVIDAGQLLTFQATASDPDAGQMLTFGLGPNAPSGATIDPTTGVFSWIPPALQGASVNLVAVTVTDNGSPPLSASQIFIVQVNAVNHPPVLDPIPGQTVEVGNTLSFTAHATDPDLPPQTLIFRLGPNAPAGAAIDPFKGVFNWTPTSSQGPNTSQVTVIVTDDGTPRLSDFKTFTLVVTAPPQPPQISQAPQSQMAAAGTNVTLAVVATGSAPLSYQWFFNGTNLAGATTAQLALTTLTTNQTGSYVVVVTNMVGSITSAPAVLTVISPPSITVPLRSQTVVAGANVLLTVTATGTEPLSYQWFFNGTLLAGATAAQLPLANVTAAQAGTYVVIVTNLAGSEASAPAILTVLAPPSITQPPQSQTVVAGSNVTLSVTAVGPGPLGYQWQFNGTNLTGATTAVLTLEQVTTNQAGAYVVVVTNLAGSVASAPAVLTVLAPPSITQPPQSQTVVAGSNVTLSVTAAGPGPLGYQWQFNGTNLTGATTALLTLNHVTTNQAGSYAVVVTNLAGSVSSPPVLLVVSAPPVLLVPPQSQTIAAGTNVSLAVTATGTPPLTYQWEFNGSDLPGATGPVLLLGHISPDQAGEYRVRVTGPGGFVLSPIAVLTVLTPPTILSPPQSLTVTAGANVTFSVVAGGSSPLAYLWRKDNVILPGATNTTLVLANVQTNAIGGYAVTVTNAVGSVTSTPALLVVRIPVVHAPPTVSILSPLNGANFAPGIGIPILATAADTNGLVQHLDFYADNTWLGALAVGADTNQYRFIWTNAPVGTHQLAVQATDDQGSQGRSAPVNISVHAVQGIAAIVAAAADPEIDRLQEYLGQAGISSYVFAQAGLTLEALQSFRLLIWDDLGGNGTGPTENTVDLFYRRLADTNRTCSLYLIGENLASASSTLSEPQRSQWIGLSLLQPAMQKGGSGAISLLDNMPANPLFHARGGDVLPFNYPARLDLTTLSNTNAEVAAQSGAADVLAAYPPLAEPDTGQRRIVAQNFLAYEGSDVDSQVQRQNLFVNVVQWLTRFTGTTFALDLSLSPVTDTAQVGLPFAYQLQVSHGGEDDATGVVVTNLLPANLLFLTADTTQGWWWTNGNQVVFELDTLSGPQTVTLHLLTIPVATGTVTNTAWVSALGLKQPRSQELATTVTSSPPLTRAPSLQIQQRQSPGYPLLLSADPGRFYRIQSSVDLSQWLDLTNFVTTTLRTSFTDPTPPAPRRFYRAISP